MPDMERVVEGLEEVIAEAVYPDRPRKFMMSLELAEDALALLKAQEPPESEFISSAIECLLHPQDADDSDMAKAIDTAVRAMRLLRFQEPRVMTLEEVEKSYSKTPIWFEEQRLQTVYPAIYHKSKGPEGAKFADITDFYYQRQDWAYGTYGKTWRCWTSRPTDAQREATPWP